MKTARFTPWMLAVVLLACGGRSRAQANNLLAAGDPCVPTGDHEICVLESTYIRLGCDAATAKWRLLGECDLTESCEMYTIPAAPDQMRTRCTAQPQKPDTASAPTSDTVASIDATTAVDAAKDAPDGKDASKSDVHKPSCGDTVCEGAETQDTCPADCQVPVCGDGKCAATEACWLDCSADGLSRSSCLKSKCPNQTSACLASDPCVGVLIAFLQCMSGGCGGASNCFAVCQPIVANNTTANSVANCGVTTCFAAQLGQCGDGVCSATESPTVCPKDCKPASTGSCAGLCGGASTDCHCDPPCVKAGDCCGDYAKLCLP